MKNILQITLIGLAILLSTSAFSQKHHPHHGRYHGILSMSEELGLTDRQVEQIEAIHKKYREQVRAIREKDVEDRSELRNEMKTVFEAQHEEVLAILTAEQQTKLEAKKAEREKLREERKERWKNVDKEGLRKAMKTYREENIDPVMKAQRAKLEEKIEAEDKVVIAELREKFETVHQRMKQERKQGAERTEGQRKRHRGGKGFKGFAEEENPDRERLRQLVEKYEEDIDALLEELEPQQQKWHEDMKKIAEEYLPETDGEEGSKAHPHKRHPRPGMKTMRKGHFLLLDPNAPAETETEGTPALAEMIVYPNPATAANTLQYNVKKAGQVRIELRTKGGNV